MFESSDLITVALLVVLEGLLSADNAIVLAVLVMPLPLDEQKKALRYGILGAFIFRIIAVFLAVYLLNMPLIKVIGGSYLVYLAVSHFIKRQSEKSVPAPVTPKQFLGLSPFWSTIIAVELTDIVFSVDSILAAVALSNKQWVVITGGMLGIITMRMVAGVFLEIIKKFPALVDGAYIIVLFIGLKLLAKYFFPDLEISEWWTFGIIGLIFLSSLALSRRLNKKEEKQMEEISSGISDAMEINDKGEN